MRPSLMLPAVALALVGACGPMYGDVDVVAPTPVMVAGPPGGVGLAPAPGVTVVAGYDDPVFMVDNGYWMWTNGGWMTWWGGNWMWAQPPVVLTTVRDPWRYRGWGGWGTRGTWGTRNGWTRGGWRPPARTTIRDHRSGGTIYRGGPARGSTFRGGSYRSPSRGTIRGGGTFRGGSRGSTIRSHRRR